MTSNHVIYSHVIFPLRSSRALDPARASPACSSRLTSALHAIARVFKHFTPHALPALAAPMAEADWPAASTAAQRRKRRSMESLVPAIDTLPKSSKRRKVDWSAVDKVGGFSLTPLKHSKKRKTEPTARSSSDHSASPSSAEIVQENPFHEAVLSRTLHRVHPEQEYLALNHYRNFTSMISLQPSRS